MNFAWSFKPFFILFIVIFGIDLDVSKERSKWGNYLIKLLAFFWFFCYNMSMALSLIIAGLKRNSNASLTMNMNDKLQFILPAILTTMFHVSFLVACFKKWNSLWEKLQHVQDMIGNQRLFYRQLRRDAIMAVLLIFVVNIFELSFLNVQRTTIQLNCRLFRK